MAEGDLVYTAARYWLGPVVRLLTSARAYGRDRVPLAGGAVLAVNHLHWIDVPLVGALTPRNITFVAKIEAHRIPLLGPFIRAHGTLAVRRGQSDREAVRLMLAAAREGKMLGLFVEGTRQRSGRPGKAMPGAAMVALQEDVPVVPAAIYGTQRWRLGNLAPCSVAYGEPIRFDGLPKGGKGYREATAEIERRIHALFDWLVDLHDLSRPKDAMPPV